jgi:rhodanese-related sulfurtransferase
MSKSIDFIEYRPERRSEARRRSSIAGGAVSSEAVRQSLLERREIALLDVRPEGRFAAGHPLFAASFPLDRLMVDVLDRIPRPATPLAVYGDTEDDALVAASRLARLGYRTVSVLENGLDGWRSSGGELFVDVNVPSKAFGELVEATARTPSVEATDLRAMLDGAADVVVVDARRFEEYRTMSIPSATSVPGAELALRISAVAPDPATLVVVNCAGRTRSIIGTQSLINAGVPNPVKALRNGTIGWSLAGLTLDHRRERRPPAPQAAAVHRASVRARRLAGKVGVRHPGLHDLPSLTEGGGRTVYRFDVRSPEEYAVAHLAGFRSAPGGQLVQETDWFAPVRGAVVALVDDDGVRANMTGSWLAQMGWDVVVIEPGMAAGATETGAWTPTLPPLPAVAAVDPAQLETRLGAGGTCVVDVDTSTRFRAGHVPGATWVTPSALPTADVLDRLGRPSRIILTSGDGTLATFAAAELPQITGTEVAVLLDGTEGWARSGRPLVGGPDGILSPPLDVYRRPYEGTDVGRDAMQAYLEWEYGLVAQLARDGTHGFNVLTT